MSVKQLCKHLLHTVCFITDDLWFHVLLNSYESELSTREQIICDMRVTFPFAHKSSKFCGFDVHQWCVSVTVCRLLVV